MRLIVISGLSGSGKSIALEALEDLDFYCVDNLPVSLLADFASQMIMTARQRNSEDVAVGIDARNVKGDLQYLQTILSEIKELDIVCEVIFIEADDSTILKRFSETRRKHPLTRKNISLIEAVEEERRLLSPISGIADLSIDTSQTNVHQLRDLVRKRVAKKSLSDLSISFVSFGYKNGIPIDADFIFDIRCLPNPHWDPRLRLQTGKDPEVIDFLQKEERVSRMFESIKSFLEGWIPCFEAENRSYITIAIGCTGGQHRSVYLADQLADYFNNIRENVLVRHRDLS